MTFAQPGDADWLFYQQAAAALAAGAIIFAVSWLAFLRFRRGAHRAIFQKHGWLLHGVPTVMLLVAAFPWPYSYYLVLRVAIFAYCAFEALTSPRKAAEDRFWIAMFVVLALVYNPFSPSHLDAEGWLIINLLSASALAWHAWTVRPLPAVAGDAAAVRP